jgi:adenosylhomocysteine nucleosidase
MLLIFYALEMEVRPFRRRLQTLKRWENQEIEGWRGNLKGAEVVLILTGVGPDRAAANARRALELFAQPQMVISTGVAGGLSAELAAGTIVVADRVLMRASGALSDAPILLPTEQTQRLARALADAGLRVAVGPTLTVPAALLDGVSKRRAHVETGAIAVDMESAPIAHEARLKGLDFVYARSVLDAVDDRLLPTRLVDDSGNIRPLTAAAFLLRHPVMLVKWTSRLARNMGVATARLAEALETIARIHA